MSFIPFYVSFEYGFFDISFIHFDFWGVHTPRALFRFAFEWKNYILIQFLWLNPISL